MNIAVRAPLLFVSVLALLAGAGCVAPAPETQIAERIASIRAAILAERVDGIFEFGTPDWQFIAPDGKRFDRAAYRARTVQMFAGIEIESLETKIDSLKARDGRAEVRITQTMVRTETDASGGRRRWRARYQESQEWVLTPARGWLVVSVRVFNPQREELPAP